jgi:hypothetical protein
MLQYVAGVLDGLLRDADRLGEIPDFQPLPVVSIREATIALAASRIRRGDVAGPTASAQPVDSLWVLETKGGGKPLPTSL